MENTKYFIEVYQLYDGYALKYIKDHLVLIQLYLYWVALPTLFILGSSISSKLFFLEA